ncbi:hypothetical protein CDAR_293151 [Caerostris darwini]|uniref:Uncharacterized protein n=1 Tax=Caerostris darwini TaxID=1538125 RepID=A0AAV4QGM5_9ARAC|nr:hypothetical protein CDAR_293151 [Caerostris darwini]
MSPKYCKLLILVIFNKCILNQESIGNQEFIVSFTVSLFVDLSSVDKCKQLIVLSSHYFVATLLVGNFCSLLKGN